MSIYSSVREAIRRTALTALSDFTNPVIVFSHQDGLEPAESYVVINMLSITQQGHHSTSTLTNLSEELSVQVAFEVMTQFTFVGSKSGDMAQTFTQNINSNPLSLQSLKANRLGLMRKTALRNNPQRRDTKWVDYNTMDVTYNYIINTNQLVDVVEGVVIADEASEIPLIIKIPESIIYP